MKRISSPTVTPEMAAHIRFLINDRGLYQHQAAALVGVNQGRISEVMHGVIHPNVPGSGSVSLLIANEHRAMVLFRTFAVRLLALITRCLAVASPAPGAARRNGR